VRENGKPIAEGDMVRNFRNEVATVTGWAEPKHDGSSGRVFVTEDGQHEQGYFPNVYGLQWKEGV
tara:strand:+ start:311 stop:505 length:195 start_codon:yes stop_codon:yes gene_type:complete